MGAKVISLCDYRKRKQGEERLQSLKGRGFPDDMVFGPDDGAEGMFSGLLGMNLSLDNPNFPYTKKDEE